MEHNLCISCKKPIPVQNLACANCRERPLPDGRPKPNYKLCLGIFLFSLTLGVAAGIYGGTHAHISRDVPPWVLSLSVFTPTCLVSLLVYLIYFILTNPEAE